ncbi:MAG: AraC family transcriptional regulator [Chitinophagaceae bacterium]
MHHRKSPRKFTVTDRHLKKAKQIEDYLTKDFSVLHSVKELADMVVLTELELQNAFKMLYGKTVSLYAREARLQYAHQQLAQTDQPLRVICELAGYPDPSNFSTAFVKQFGYRPGTVRNSAGLTDKTIAIKKIKV